MENYSYHSRVRLENFTVFKEATFEFCPGVNAIIGENGTGKTHLLKAMYAAQRPHSRLVSSTLVALQQLFQIADVSGLCRTNYRGKATEATICGEFGATKWSFCVARDTTRTDEFMDRGNPVFIPAMDMMGHTKGFQQAYNGVFLDFDLSCYDVVDKFLLKRRPEDGAVRETAVAHDNYVQPGRDNNLDLGQILGGKVTDDPTTGRFTLETQDGSFEMPLVGEGIRKIASLVRLEDNNWLTPGSTLYWDEPEANLNPVLMQGVVAEILRLARTGLQVFITTHSYVILKELDLQASTRDTVRYFSLYGSKENGTQITTTDDFTSVSPNAILNEYSSLYDRELSRATGRTSNGERIR